MRVDLIFMIFLGFFAFCFVIGASFFIILESRMINSDCAKEIAQDFCEEQGYKFSEVVTSHVFDCKMNERERSGTRFDFLKGEIRECMKK